MKSFRCVWGPTEWWPIHYSRQSSQAWQVDTQINRLRTLLKIWSTTFDSAAWNYRLPFWFVLYDFRVIAPIANGIFTSNLLIFTGLSTSRSCDWSYDEPCDSDHLSAAYPIENKQKISTESMWLLGRNRGNQINGRKTWDPEWQDLTAWDTLLIQRTMNWWTECWFFGLEKDDIWRSISKLYEKRTVWIISIHTWVNVRNPRTYKRQYNH